MVDTYFGEPLPDLPDTGLPDHIFAQFAGRAVFAFKMSWPISANTYFSKNKRWASAKGREWRDRMCRQIWQQIGRRDPEPLIGPVAIYHEIWVPDDNRSRDLDNFTGKHIQDVYQAMGALSNDSQVKQEHKYWNSKWRKGGLVVHLAEL